MTLLVSVLTLGILLPVINKSSGGKIEEQFDKWLGVTNSAEKPNSGTQNEEKSLYEKRHANDIIYTLDANQAMKEGFYTYNMGSNMSQVSRIGSDSGLYIDCSTEDSEGNIVKYITGSNGSKDTDLVIGSNNLINLSKYNSAPKTLRFAVDTDYLTSNELGKYISYEMMLHSDGREYSSDEVFRVSLLNQNNSEKQILFAAKKESVNIGKDKLTRFNSLINVSDYTNEEKDLMFLIDVQKDQPIYFDYIRWTFSDHPFGEEDFNKYIYKLNHGEINYYDIDLATISDGMFSYNTDSSFFILDKDSTLTFAFRDPENKITLEEKEIRGSFDTCVGKKKRANNWTYFQFKFANSSWVIIDADSYVLGANYVAEMDIASDVMIYPSGTIPSDEHYAKLNPITKVNEASNFDDVDEAF